MSTNIAWTNETWNPVTGCSHVSAGCLHCYAETLSLRRGWSKKVWTARNAAENVHIHVDRLDKPTRWAKPRMVFVNSMSDLFHENVPLAFIRLVFSVMATEGRHTFQVLTKRADRMHEIVSGFDWRFGMSVVKFSERATLLTHHPLPDGTDIGHSLGRGWVPPNVWLGVSVEDQQNADERIPLLLETPAAVRFISAEPLLGPISFPLPCPGSVFWGGLHWVIAGGESGADHRTMDVGWFRSLREQCAAAGVPFFAKQDSGNRPGKQGRIPDELWVQEFPQPGVPA